MWRRLFRSRFLLTLLCIVAITSAWTIWWMWPESPILKLRFRGHMGRTTIQVARDGKAAHISSRRGCRLIRLPNGEDIIAPELVQPMAVFLEQSAIYMFEFARDCSIVDLTNGHELFRTWEPTGLRRWSTDGRIVVWVRDNDEIVHLVDTINQRTIVLPDAKPPFSIDQSGQWVVTLVHDEPTAFALWDVSSGREFRRCYSPNDMALRSAEMSHDGRYIVTHATRPADERLPFGSTVLWDLLEGTGTILDDLNRGDGKTPIGQGLFSGQSNWLLTMTRGQGTDCWNLAKRPLHPIRLADVPFFDPAHRRYLFKQDRPDALAFSGPGSWVLFDAESMQEIARGPYSSRKDYNLFENPLPHSKWFAIERDRERGDWETKVLSFLNRPHQDPAWMDIRSVATGHRTNCLPVDSLTKLAGFTDDGHVWTQSSDFDESTETHYDVLHQWRAEARTPYWLYFLTIAVAVICVRLWPRKSADRRFSIPP